MLHQFKFIALLVQFILISTASGNLTSPSDKSHPGSLIYDYGYESISIKSCIRGRETILYKPKPLNSNTPVIVFGHGQALNESHYKDSYVHLAKKGIAVVHVDYSTGFFDQNWIRMAGDYIQLAECALSSEPNLDQNAVVFSGHSKGAYVAGIAAGLAFQKNTKLKPQSALLFNAAGLDLNILKHLNPDIEMLVVFSDKDTIVEKKISEDLYKFSPSLKKQFIEVKSYPSNLAGKAIKADHFWVLTKGSLLGGTIANPLHYYGMWKLLIGLADDASSGGRGENPYAFGNESVDKGVNGLTDSSIRNY
jgi:alpha/beta superfamily hydrolase